MPGDELCGLTNVVHVCAVGGACDLRGETRMVLVNPGELLPPDPAGGSGAIREHLHTHQFESGHSQDKAMSRCWNMPLTWSLPIATRQNLLPWPASGSSSGSETPERGEAKAPSRVNTEGTAHFRGSRHSALPSVYLPPCSVTHEPFPWRNLGSCLPLLLSPEGLKISVSTSQQVRGVMLLPPSTASPCPDTNL